MNSLIKEAAEFAIEKHNHNNEYCKIKLASIINNFVVCLAHGSSIYLEIEVNELSQNYMMKYKTAVFIPRLENDEEGTKDWIELMSSKIYMNRSIQQYFDDSNMIKAAEFAVLKYVDLRFEKVLRVGKAIGSDFDEWFMVIQAYDTRENISKVFKTKIVDYNADNYMESTGLMYLSTCPIPEWIPFELLEKSTRLFRNEKYQLFRDDGLTAERFKTIAQSIGEKSTRSDFISSLTYQLDVDDTINEYVLCEVAQVLGDFVPYIGGIKYANCLFAPLVILCNIADYNVREKAIQSLCKIGEQINTSTLIHDFTLHILQLVDGNLFRAQASALGLYHIIYSTAPEDVKTTLRMHYIKLCRHTHPLVRKSAATHIGKFVAVVEPFYRKTDIMTMFKVLTQDDLDFVRLYSIVSCAPLMELFEPQVYVAHILPVISKLSQDVFWRVRYTIADQFLEFCKSATLEATRVELISIFVRLVRDEHCEVRLAATSKVSALCGIWNTELAMQDILFHCVKELSSDSALDVRAALISEILSMALVFGKDVAIEKLLPIIRSLLADESSFVQLNVISKIDQVAKVVGIDQLSHQLVDVTDKLVNDTDWLVRYEVTKNYIPLLASHLSGATSIVDKLTDLCKQRMEDEKPCVCVAANESFKRLAKMNLVIPHVCCLN